MITNLRSSWLLNKFSFSKTQELYKKTVRKICILMLGCKGLKVFFLCKYVLLQMGLKFWSKNKIKKKPANLFSARVSRLLTWRLAIVPFADKTQSILTSCSWLLTVNNPCPTAGRRENVKKQRGTMWDHGKKYSLGHPSSPLPSGNSLPFIWNFQSLTGVGAWNNLSPRQNIQIILFSLLWVLFHILGHAMIKISSYCIISSIANSVRISDNAL